jgi:peptidoglycan hydrolase-like protein with peptidoglycan-binding domain
VRRRPKKAAAIAIESHGNGLGSVITRYPREFVGFVMASGAVLAVFINALFLQSGPHPAPIFATRPLLAASGPVRLPSPRVAPPVNQILIQPQPLIGTAPSTVASAVQLTANIQRELSRRGYYDGVADGIWGAKTDAGVRDFLQVSRLTIAPEASESLLRALAAAPIKPQAASAATANPSRNDPIAALIAPSQRVLAIQRALSDFGYGQIKPTGTYNLDTRMAIEKFERDHRLPITGQISDRFVRELAGMTGRPLE